MSSRPSDFTLTSPGPLRLYSMTELLKLPPPTWLIKDILPSGGLIGLYGQPGTSKSFVAIDFAMCVATGKAWLGHDVEPGWALYISAEGGAGIGKRGAAWVHHHQADPRTAKIVWLIESMHISSTADSMEQLFDRVQNELGLTPSLVVIDTLARCFDGDENQQEDMGKFVAGVDRLRKEFGATVIVVHHTRLDGDRERGNTAFRGAADAMISIVRDKPTGHITLSCSKQKDAEEFAPFQLMLTAVPEFESCVIESATQNVEGRILEVLAGGPHSLKALQQRLPSLSKSTILRRLRELVGEKILIREEDERHVTYAVNLGTSK